MTDGIDLTPKQAELLAYLNEQYRVHGRTPTLRDAALANGVTHAAIAQMLKALEKKGYIRRDGKYSRVIRLNPVENFYELSESLKRIPIVGTIAAGLPLYAQQVWDGSLMVDGTVFKGEHLFGLRILGDSMKNAGILDGDTVICEPRQFAGNGEIVAALINHEEATVKRFYLRKSHIELQPDNPDFKPVRYGFEEVLIQGKVIGLIRGPGSFGA
ncbi:transcriptional repressor LexA [Desulfatiferula olefinivorans]